MTTLTLITVAVIVYGVFGAAGYCRALALGGVTAAGAALVVGSVAVPTFYAVALGTVVALGIEIAGRRRHPASPAHTLPPGVPLLLLFFAWSTLVTVVAPVLFDGMPVLVPSGAVGRLASGVLTSSNFAQITYLALGICVVVFVARAPSAGPELIGLAAGLTTVLSLWRYLNQVAGIPFPEGIFDNSPFFVYIETAAGGVQRFRGILSEPSALAGSSLVTVSYMLSRSVRLRGPRLAGALVLAAVAAYLGAISTSTTFIVAGVATALVAAVVLALGFTLRRTSVSAVVGLAACTAVVAAIWVVPLIADFVESTVNQKVSTSSFGERSGANTASYGIFLDTYGLGTGLGASRAAAFVPGLLSTTGVVGTLLFAIVVAGLIRRALPMSEYRPVVWALATLLISKTIAGPDLSDSSGILWISLGLLSRAAMTAYVPIAIGPNPVTVGSGSGPEHSVGWSRPAHPTMTRILRGPGRRHG